MPRPAPVMATDFPCKYWATGADPSLVEEPEQSEDDLEGVEQFQFVELVGVDPARFRRLPVERGGRRELLGHVQHDGGVRPAAVVVLVDVGNLVPVVVEQLADLLSELPERGVERFFTVVAGPAGN